MLRALYEVINEACQVVNPKISRTFSKYIHLQFYIYQKRKKKTKSKLSAVIIDSTQWGNNSEFELMWKDMDWLKTKKQQKLHSTKLKKKAKT